MASTNLPALVPAPVLEFVQNVFTSGEFSDLEIVCGDNTWRVHKFAVFPHSKVLKKACNGEFKEAKEGRITLKEDDPRVIGTMLHYFYFWDYNDEDLIDQDLSAIMLNINMLAAANKYLVEPLEKLALEKFGLRGITEWHTEGFADAVASIYNDGSNVLGRLKPIVMDIVRLHANELFTDTTYAAFQRVVQASPGFLFDFSKELLSEAATKNDPTLSKGATWYKCTGASCQQHNAMFCVGDTVPAHFRLSCPLMCNISTDPNWWKSNIVKKS